MGLAIDTAVEELLDLMAMPARANKLHRPMRYYSRAVPFISAWLKEGGSDIVLPVDGRLYDVYPSLDVSFLTEVGAGIGLNRVRFPPLRSTRGAVPDRWRRRGLVEWSFGAVVPSKGRTTAFGGVHYLWNGTEIKREKPSEPPADENWLYVGPFYNHSGEANAAPRIVHDLADQVDVQRIKLAIGLEFIRQWTWDVELQIDDGPSLSFMTDHDGISEVFRLRDIPPGRSRRSALRHWVKHHWRFSKLGSPHHVRRHMRGKETFHWNGLRCVIHPAKDDIAAASQEHCSECKEEHDHQRRHDGPR